MNRHLPGIRAWLARRPPARKGQHGAHPAPHSMAWTPVHQHPAGQHEQAWTWGPQGPPGEPLGMAGTGTACGERSHTRLGWGTTGRVQEGSVLHPGTRAGGAGWKEHCPLPSHCPPRAGPGLGRHHFPPWASEPGASCHHAPAVPDTKEQAQGTLRAPTSLPTDRGRSLSQAPGDEEWHSDPKSGVPTTSLFFWFQLHLPTSRQLPSTLTADC